jgi:hypothetical protein
MMADARRLLGGEQAPRPLDEDVRGVLGRVVGRVDDHVDPVQRDRQAGARREVDRVLRAAAAEHANVVAARAQLLGDSASQRSRSSCDGDGHARETTQPAQV